MNYAGSELELFARAKRWKTYLARQITPFVTGHVLEVGAGIGSNIDYLFNPQVQEWLALEPDPRLSSVIAERQRTGELPKICQILTGTLNDTEEKQFDTILYIDVLEHIEQDRAQVAQAASRLRPNGRLIILSPAHQFLFSPFDASIGHFRRYGAGQLEQLRPPGCSTERLRMLDSTGFLLSLANRLIMKSAMPTHSQIALWDRMFVRVSTVLDPVLGYRFGKSILVVWNKAESGRL